MGNSVKKMALSTWEQAASRIPHSNKLKTAAVPVAVVVRSTWQEHE